jgi:selenocysteine lyase/cysteine desulfurase
MFVKKDKIPAMWTMFSNADPNSGDIRKFEFLGTRSFPAEQAIGNALKFHNMVGTRRKEARLQYLKNYWVDQVRDLPKVKLHTSQLPQYSCAIATFSVEGKTGKEVNQFLFNNYKIHCTPIEREVVDGVRVTPHIYTTLPELDRLVKAIRELAA